MVSAKGDTRIDPQQRAQKQAHTNTGRPLLHKRSNGGTMGREESSPANEWLGATGPYTKKTLDTDLTPHKN